MSFDLIETLHYIGITKQQIMPMLLTFLLYTSLKNELKGVKRELTGLKNDVSKIKLSIVEIQSILRTRFKNVEFKH